MTSLAIIARMVEPTLHPLRSIVSFGDIHGDFDALRRVLLQAHLMNDKDQWVGGDRVLVQVGDLLDDGGRERDDGTCCIEYETKGDEELRILELFLRLKMQAQQQGGDVRVALGNHEALVFAGLGGRLHQRNTEAFYAGKRNEIFQPGSPLCRKLAHLLEVVIVVDNNVFCHGGVTEKNIKSLGQIDHLNWRLTQALRGELPNAQAFFNGLLQAQSPLSVRDFGYAETKEICRRLANIKKAFAPCIPNARFFIGHTVQEDGINAICDNSLYRMDVMMGRAFGVKSNPRDRLEYLEIVNGDVVILKL